MTTNGVMFFFVCLFFLPVPICGYISNHHVNNCRVTFASNYLRFDDSGKPPDCECLTNVTTLYHDKEYRLKMNRKSIFKSLLFYILIRENMLTVTPVIVVHGCPFYRGICMNNLLFFRTSSIPLHSAWESLKHCVSSGLYPTGLDKTVFFFFFTT